MVNNCVRNTQNQNMKKDALRQKANVYFLLAIGAIVFFSILYCLFAFWYKNPQKSIIASGAFICLYFAYQGYVLLDISKKQDYEVERYICSDIEKTGYRKQYRRIIFLHSEKKEPFIYNTNKNMEFIEGMEYEIYFKKAEHKTSNSVLAISLSDTQKEFMNFKKKKKKE